MSEPGGVDIDRANAARMYDHFLGGGHDFAVDREAAARVTAGLEGLCTRGRPRHGPATTIQRHGSEERTHC